MNFKIFILWILLFGCQNNSIPNDGNQKKSSVTSPIKGNIIDSEKNSLNDQNPAQETTETTKLNVKPLLSHQVTSGWCVKRSVGTCPHIGVDLIPGSGGMNSYAIGTGSVEKIKDVGGCGFQSQFRDNKKALWGYLHIGKPSYAVGHKLFAGELIGAWYGGNSSCVTGPHLHLERLEPGSYGGEKTGGNHCGTGYRNCNYDAYTPLKTMLDMKDEAGRKDVVSQAKGESKKSITVFKNLTTCSAQNLFDFTPSDDQNIDDLSPDTNVSIQAQISTDGSVAMTGHLLLIDDFTQNNSCLNSSACIASWELLVRTSKNWVRVASAVGVQNAPVKIQTPTFCSGEQKVFPLVVIARLEDNRVLKTSLTVEAH